VSFAGYRSDIATASVSRKLYERCAHRAGGAPSSATWRFRRSATMWSGAGSNRRPSAFQVNRAKRYADLQQRMSLTSGTALGGRCNLNASRTPIFLFTVRWYHAPRGSTKNRCCDFSVADCHLKDSKRRHSAEPGLSWCTSQANRPRPRDGMLSGTYPR
jgi:hypothetical protein